MPQPLKIEVPDEQCATSLRLSLAPHNVETHAVDGHFEVRVDFMDRSPETRLVKVLNAIDQWLLTTEVPFVRVHLDGSSHTLHRPTIEPLASSTPR